MACWFYSAEERKEKSCCLCAQVICCLTHVINNKIIEDKEIFLLPFIKPPGTYFNNKLLPSCRSLKFSSSFPTTTILCVLRWIQFVLIEIQRVCDGKVFKFFLDKHCIESYKETLHFLLNSFQPDSFSNNLNRFKLDFM